MSDYQAAIDVDEYLDRPLTDINASDFVRVLSSKEFTTIKGHLADKKKYELWVEEEPVFRMPLKEIVAKLNEKKKVELEVPFDWRWLVDPPPQFIDTLAEKVAERLQR